MHNFLRALRLVIPYRVTLVLMVITAWAVALFWAADIGGIYPAIQVLFPGQSLQTYIDKEIASTQQQIVNLNKTIAKTTPTAKTSLSLSPATAAAVLIARENLEAEQTRLTRQEWLKGYIDAYLPNDAYMTLVVIMMVLLVATIVKCLFLMANSYLVDRLTQLATMRLRKDFFRRTLELDLGTFSQHSATETLSRFTHDVDHLGQGMNFLLGRAIREPLKMVGCFAAAAYICWPLLVLTMVIAPPAGYCISRLSRSLKRANRRAMEEMSSLYNILGEAFTGIKVVKGFTMERYERRRFHNNSKQIYTKSMKIARYDAMVNPITEMMGIGMICTALLAGAYLVLRQQTHLLGIPMSQRPLTFPALIMFYGFLVGATDPARKLSDIFNRLQRAAAAADRVYQLLDREPAVRDVARPRVLNQVAGRLTFENVDFAYTPDSLVLENVSLTIRPGETLAIVGPNGCGKTTLVNLIPRFFEPRSGKVLLDGVDLRELKTRDLRRHIGIVTQDPVLFDDTVLNNIRYGTTHATREQVIDAARRAHAHRFIESKLEDGYETIIGPGGNRLSGGQRQRLALARAILRDPTILILDEATSQIDIESEHLIHQVLEQFTKGRTTVMITHRLSTLDLADRVLVMNAGKVVDIGTRDELLRRCPFFQRLYQLQREEAA